MRPLVFAALTAVMLAGCGQAGLPTAASLSSTGASALSRAATPGQQAKKALKLLDTDKDGAISLEEWQAYELIGAKSTLESVQKKLEAAEAKGDDRQIKACRMELEVAESVIEDVKEASAGRFGHIDTDHSGKVEQAELTPQVVKYISR